MVPYVPPMPVKLDRRHGGMECAASSKLRAWGFG